MTCAVCGTAAFEHVGFGGWLCPGCAQRGAEAYEEAQGLGRGEN